MTEPTRQSDMVHHSLPRYLSAIRHVILDRDGVLNEEPPHGGSILEPKDFHWLPGALDALTALHASGMRISIATNQSAIGRSLMTESALMSIHDKMASEARGTIDAVFFCPHAPDAGCSCRKPASGLIEAAINESGIAARHTLLVGDSARDLQAAHTAGIRAALLRSGKGLEHECFAKARDVPIYNDLYDLVAHLVSPLDSPGDLLDRLQATFAEHVAVVADSALSLLPALVRCIGVAQRSLCAGGTLLACGNGGSAADAEHFVAELVGRFHLSRRALSAIALTSNAATITAVSNDFGYPQVFARQVEAFARAGDVLIALSTSGNSANVLNAAQVAQRKGCTVMALTGRTGGSLAQVADIALQVPSDVVARIQEVHGLCLHSLAEALDASIAQMPP